MDATTLNVLAFNSAAVPGDADARRVLADCFEESGSPFVAKCLRADEKGDIARTVYAMCDTLTRKPDWLAFAFVIEFYLPMAVITEKNKKGIRASWDMLRGGILSSPMGTITANDARRLAVAKEAAPYYMTPGMVADAVALAGPQTEGKPSTMMGRPIFCAMCKSRFVNFICPKCGPG